MNSLYSNEQMVFAKINDMQRERDADRLAYLAVSNADQSNVRTLSARLSGIVALFVKPKAPATPSRQQEEKRATATSWPVVTS